MSAAGTLDPLAVGGLVIAGVSLAISGTVAYLDELRGSNMQ
jgi:hypothetical protein